MIKKWISLLSMAALNVIVVQAGEGGSDSLGILWYAKPATNWEQEALPIGNGRLGGMVFGDPAKEHVQFNEDSLWIGDEEDTGAYQAFGDLYIDLGHKDVKNYRRELDISKAVQTTTYQSGSINYKREFFSSYPAQVMVLQFSADQPGAYTGKVILTDTHKGIISCRDNKISSSGVLKGYTYKGKGEYKLYLDYEAQVQVIPTGGTLTVETDGIAFKNCDSLTVLLAADTNYLNQRDKGWKAEHPHQRISDQLAKASEQSFDDLLKGHIDDYQALFNRLTLDLGVSSKETLELSTKERLAAYQGGDHDPELEQLVFQYARYLMISCSRPGSLPANLQGLWNQSNQPPWRSDYHSDVNLQMNYWFVDQANLSECFTPLSEWLYSVVPVKREATKRGYGVRGWAHRSENGIFGGATANWIPGDAAWVMQNIWDHYAFTKDREYLETRAYPLLKELCEFWEDFLIEWPNGKLVSPKSVSPEHGPMAEGNSYEQRLVYDLFTNYIEASEALGQDEAYRETVRSMRSRLLGPQIGKWGQLQEWAKDIDDPKDKHRHLSHLIAVHPGRQISPLTTPELAEAARVSLNARGDGGQGWRDGGTGWSRAWKINLWARLHDGNRAYKLLSGQLKSNYYSNLLSFHAPFQIDGNFGYAAGVCEMLMQSHMGQIHLLPALPDAWADGQVKGLRARGGFVVDVEWSEGQLSKALIRSEVGKVCRLRTEVPVTIMQAGRKVVTQTMEDGLIEFSTKEAQEYSIVPEKNNKKQTQTKQAPAYHASVPKPTLSDIPYGTHERQVLDFWKAPSASAANPAPLVFYIHGGSWQTSSKEIINGCVDVNALLKAGISVAAINYRYVSQAEAAGVVPPVKVPLTDAARALQFVRSKAQEWNIDKIRIGATGASAGGCSSLWLAYHDEMADPESDDPVARESTRLFCAGVRVPQTSLDPQQMKDWLTKITYGGHAFGVKNWEFLESRDDLLPWIKEYSPYAHVSSDDPPVSLYYNRNLEKDLSAHSPQFAFHLQKRCKELGLFCEVLYDRAPGYKQNEATFYLIKTLTAPAVKNDPDKFDISAQNDQLPAFKKGARLVFLGDSITDMNRGRNERDRNHYLGHSFVFMLAGRLGIEMPEAQLDFYNRGIGGNSVADLKARWQKDAIEMRPDVLTILVGTNDVGKGVKPAAFETDYRAILSASRHANPDLKIILLDPFVLKSGGLINDRAWISRRDATDQLRPIVAKLAKEYGAVHIEMQELFDAAAKSVSPDYWMWDGIHPLPPGHELIARHWLKAVSARWPKGSDQTIGQDETQATLTCPSGHNAHSWQSIDKSVDGDVKTKWCLKDEGHPLQWQVKLLEPRVVNRYIFTSANDVPERDPKEWKWEGSSDGNKWVLLDHRKEQPQFSSRLHKESYTFENTSSYKFYRLTLHATTGNRSIHQLAEIELAGVDNISME